MIFKKLDLSGFLQEFKALLARDKPLFLEGDAALHFRRISELSRAQFPPAPNLSNLDKELIHLSKQGILHLESIFHFVRICRYFLSLKRLEFGESLDTWLAKIILPQSVLELCAAFDEKGELKSELDERLQGFRRAIALKKEQISSELRKLAHSKSLSAYLIDTQLH